MPYLKTNEIGGAYCFAVVRPFVMLFFVHAISLELCMLGFDILYIES